MTMWRLSKIEVEKVVRNLKFILTEILCTSFIILVRLTKTTSIDRCSAQKQIATNTFRFVHSNPTSNTNTKKHLSSRPTWMHAAPPNFIPETFGIPASNASSY